MGRIWNQGHKEFLFPVCPWFHSSGWDSISSRHKCLLELPGYSLLLRSDIRESGRSVFIGSLLQVAFCAWQDETLPQTLCPKPALALALWDWGAFCRVKCIFSCRQLWVSGPFLQPVPLPLHLTEIPPDFCSVWYSSILAHIFFSSFASLWQF